MLKIIKNYSILNKESSKEGNMKLNLFSKKRKLKYFPDTISELRKRVEEELFEPSQIKDINNKGISIWEDLEFYYNDSESDKNDISEEEDLKNAKRYK